ncbi:MAG: alpha/beta hydrolase [Erythrobacter sp.]|jgi:hypothetical protein
MSRVVLALLSFLGLAISAPAAAQSLTLVAMPVVYVSKPVVQQVHAGRAIVPQVRVVARPGQEVAGFAPARARPALSATPLPTWQAPFVDRQLRDYRRGIAQYGPFRVLDSRRVALVGETGAGTPRAFRAMLRDFPGLAQLDMVECPGTRDDIANMQLGRMIRAAGMVTHVPATGSVRSGAVELFFAGVERDISDGAEFAVHSWMDDYGREAGDFAIDAPQNRKYIDYYHEMGMSAGQARAFYDFTNSVLHNSALWLTARDMRGWARPAYRAVREAPRPVRQPAPQLVYADMTFS